MYLRMIRSKICGPSNFHKPNFCTSHMQKTTRSDLPVDEMARRKEYQKIIDYTFGPPKLHEHDDISSDLARKEDNDSATNLMENLKDKPLHSTHAVFGQGHKSTQKGEELWSQQNLQEAHRINSQNWPRQAPQTDFGECRADSSNLYSVQQIGCPHYYRQMEAQMYDNFAQKYLRTETDEIDKLDKLLAMEMESLELPKPERKDMRAPINKSNNVDTVDTRGYHTDASVSSQTVAPDHNHQWCTHCCEYFPPHLNDMTTINLFHDNVEEGYTVESNSYDYHDDILPINVIHCSDLPLDCVPKSISNPPNEKLKLDEYEPCPLLQPAPLVQEGCIEWGDDSRKILQPIESSETIVQILAYPESAVDSKPQNVRVNESTDHHIIEEARQSNNVNYDPQIEPKKNQQQLHPLTKMNQLIETHISEHINTHQGSYAQAHLEAEQTTEPLKPWTEEKLEKMMRNNLVDPSPVENTESGPRRTDAVEQSFMHATPHGLEQQERFNPFAAENSEPSPQQQTWANRFRVENTEPDPRRTDAVEQNFVQATPHGLEQQERFNPFAAENSEPSPQQQTWANRFRVENTQPDPRRTDTVEQNFVQATPHGLEQQARINPFAVENSEPSPQQQTLPNFGQENKEPSPQRTDSMVRHCVHAPSISHSEPNAKTAARVDDILTNLHLDESLSLSELLQRVRALNRLQYCRECGVAVASQCPPTDRPQCPPPPDCARECPPPKKPKCSPKPECPPQPPCPPPQPTCPSEPKCPPPKPKCPPEPKCPQTPSCPPPETKKPKCPSPCPPPVGPGKCGCHSTEPDHPYTVAPRTLLKGKLSEYFMALMEGLSKLKHTLSLDSFILEKPHPSDRETLQLNRVKDYEPWVPLPSWPYPVDVKKKKLQCPVEGCPWNKQLQGRPNCPPLPCTGFPKRLKISEAN